MPCRGACFFGPEKDCWWREFAGHCVIESTKGLTRSSFFDTKRKNGDKCERSFPMMDLFWLGIIIPAVPDFSADFFLRLNFQKSSMF